MSSHSKMKTGASLEASQVNQQLKEEILRLLVDGRLPCKEAHDLALQRGVDLLEIGIAANALNIKISRCQLGCF